MVIIMMWYKSPSGKIYMHCILKHLPTRIASDTLESLGCEISWFVWKCCSFTTGYIHMAYAWPTIYDHNN